jgi:hypothetical protein
MFHEQNLMIKIWKKMQKKTETDYLFKETRISTTRHKQRYKIHCEFRP